MKLDATLGEEAETLMELLPPVGWADVATKHDLEHQTQLFDLRMSVLEHKVDAKFAAMLQAQNARFDQVDAKFDLAAEQTTNQIGGLRSEFRGGLVALVTGLLTSQFIFGVLYVLFK